MYGLKAKKTYLENKMKERVNHIWHDDWIIENIEGFTSYTEAAEAYRSRFNVDISMPALKNHCRFKLGIRKSRGENYRHVTDEQANWLRDIYPKVGVKESRRLWNEKYRDNLSVTCIKQIARRICDITVDQDVAVANKLKAAHSQGSKRALRKPGDTRVECGRLVMKTENGEWQSAGRCIWEKRHGKIPDGFALVALDGDTFNIDPSNLEIVPWKYLGKMLKNDFFSSDPEITRTGIIWCDLEGILERRNFNGK